MTGEARNLEPHDESTLAPALEPVLVEQCGGRLAGIEWFRSTWQHGGAATGYARWRTGDDADPAEIEVLVKLPVGPSEHHWTTLLAPRPGENGAPSPTPRVLASGTSLGGYDLAWLVTERIHGRPLSAIWSERAAHDLLAAAASLQARAIARAPLAPPPPDEDWPELVDRARRVARAADMPNAQKWNDALRHAEKVIKRLARRWSERSIDSWCHGDLHPGNALALDRDGGCVLIDLGFVHAGNWIEDAVYLERQFWGRPDGLFGVHTVSELARHRRALGLSTDGDYGALANVRRVLMAATVPVFLAHEGHPRYVQAALELLERLLPQVGR